MFDSRLLTQKKGAVVLPAGSLAALAVIGLTGSHHDATQVSCASQPLWCYGLKLYLVKLFTFAGCDGSVKAPGLVC
jgi:hypothetical protein